MRALPLLLVLLVALSGCGDSTTAPERPETVRKCGELEGVQPVEPSIIGQFPIPSGPDEVGGCPIIQPVPCTKPIAEYVSLCGECAPQVAAGSEGDAWLVGCAWRSGFCGGLDYSEDFCVVDPQDGQTYWIHVTECSPAFLPMAACWSPCEGEREEEPAEWCP
jgi:hypothetical protein